MTNYIEPTEEYGGRIRVKLLDHHADTQVIPVRHARFFAKTEASQEDGVI